MVASNLARQEIKPYAQLFEGEDRLTVFDCGANRGLWTRAVFESFPHASIDVHLFEPSPKNCAFIRDRDHGLLYTAEQFNTVKINKVAVGAENGELEFYSDWEGSWLGSLVKRPDVAVSQVERVPVVTIDGYAEANGIDKIDILKLDVEGWELHALKGAERLLSHGAIRTILFEFSQANVFSRTFFYDFWCLLTKHDFDIFYLESEVQMTPVISYDGKWEKFWGTSLYFAHHREGPSGE